jgi:hypothetical protein
VSLLAGIIGGNPFGIILLRLVLSAVVCAGLGLGVNLIIRKYFPELSTTPSAAENGGGEEVDIVIDEDIPMAEERAEVQGEDAQGQDLPLVQEEAEGSEQVLMPGEPEEDVLPLEDADEEIQFLAEEASSAEPVSEFEDLDALPDIEQFDPAAEENVSKPRESRMNPQVEQVVRDQDPESLARAVRTFMKKDQ